MNIPAFPKIFALGHRTIQNIYEDEVEITEKIDGSQLGWGKVREGLVIRSKGKEIISEAPDKMFSLAVQVIKGFENKIPNNMVYWGEYLQKPKHNNLAYKQTPYHNIALFGAMNLDTQKMYTYSHLKEAADMFDIDVVPLLGLVENCDFEYIEHLLEQTSYLGGSKIEGVVVKNYTKDALVGGMYVPLLVGKFVSEAYKEVATGRKKNHTSKGSYEDMKESYRTEARWWKSIQHLREEGCILGDPKDIGPLIKKIQLDIVNEEIDYIKDQLWTIFGKEILRKSVAGFPEFYKHALAEGKICE